MIDVLTEICNRIRRTEEQHIPWTISLVSHPSKVMQKVILNRLNPQAEDIIAEEQAGCRAGRSTTTTVGVRQGCLLSPTLFNIFLERIMSTALEEHDGKVSIGGRNLTNLRFADDTYALAQEEQELEALVEGLEKTYTSYKMEISAD